MLNIWTSTLRVDDVLETRASARVEAVAPCVQMSSRNDRSVIRSRWLSSACLIASRHSVWNEDVPFFVEVEPSLGHQEVELGFGQPDERQRHQLAEPCPRDLIAAKGLEG